MLTPKNKSRRGTTARELSVKGTYMAAVPMQAQDGGCNASAVAGANSAATQELPSLLYQPNPSKSNIRLTSSRPYKDETNAELWI